MPRITNPLPQLVNQRLNGVQKQLAALIWERWTELTVLGGPVNATPVALADAPAQKFVAVKAGAHFGKAKGDWQQRWFRIEIPAPEKGEKGRRFLEWQCQGETTVWLDGEPWAGLDVGHLTCPLPDRAATLWLDCGTYATGIWAPGFQPIGQYGCRFDGARLGLRNELAWDAHWDLDVLLQMLVVQLKANNVKGADFVGLLPVFDSVSPLLRQLARALDEACDAWVAGGVAAFKTALAAVIARFPAEQWQPLAALCGHAHIDLVWLWPEMATERKGVHTYATMLRLMERYPEFRFSASQPALYRAIERQAPGQYRAIKARIAAGQWEAMGGFEVEPDNNLPSGEALARSLAIGQRKLAELRGGKLSALCWIPDVFGYSACLPQILRLGGVDSFYTTKMTWSALNKFPYNSFVWRGHDGSEVLTHLCSVGYNGMCEVHENVNALKDHRQADVHPAMLLPQGLGDGGGGTTESALERARRLRSLAGAPKHAWTRAEDFFADLRKRREKLPVYQGELYLEYHRGTYTTQSEYKRAYRGLERALQVHEAVRVVTDRQPLDETAWRRLAFAQFHDAIPGSSITLVYQQLTPELTAHADTALSAAAQELTVTGQHPGLLVFNPLPLPRHAVVELPAGLGAALRTPDGLALPMQNVGSGKHARVLTALKLAGLGSERVLGASAGDTSAAANERILSANTRLLDNGVVQAAFDAAGQLIGLRIDGEQLALDGAVGLRMYHDLPANFDAWDIDHYSYKTHTVIGAELKLELVEAGPVRAVLRGSAPCGDKSRVTVSYILEAGSRWLRVEVAADWREEHRLLKFHVPTTYRGRTARFGAPFGAVARPQAPGGMVEEAQWEVPGQRWAAVLRDDGHGLALVTEAKYGFSCKDGDLGVTLLRAPSDPDPVADRGEHIIRFALGRHEAATIDSVPSTAAAADTLFTPPLVVTGGSLAQPPLAIDHPGTLVPSWVQPVGDGGFVLRLHETAGAAGEAVLLLAERPQAVELVDFLGRVLGKPKRLTPRSYALAYAPYQVLSVRVR